MTASSNHPKNDLPTQNGLSQCSSPLLHTKEENYLKEEPSDPQSLSIFESKQIVHKMHNRRRPVVEIAIHAKMQIILQEVCTISYKQLLRNVGTPCLQCEFLKSRHT
jgi:hypothetical protein